ncbi:MAG TPA: HipA family kinase, partial [Longimicrobium sp.]
MQEITTHTATRYLQPLREGGSLPAIVDTEDGGRFVVKFRGAGQGAKVLVAELIVGLLAGELGFAVPELALIEVPPEFGRSEPDPEIQELLQKSHGINVGLRYLDGAFNFDGYAAGDLVDDRFASDLVWLDALVTNPDRTHRNPNLLLWERRPWLIDHGAALYAHYDWKTVDEARTKTPFPLTKQHVLLRRATELEAADERLS